MSIACLQPSKACTRQHAAPSGQGTWLGAPGCRQCHRCGPGAHLTLLLCMQPLRRFSLQFCFVLLYKPLVSFSLRQSTLDIFLSFCISACSDSSGQAECAIVLRCCAHTGQCQPGERSCLSCPLGSIRPRLKITINSSRHTEEPGDGERTSHG